MRLLLVVFALAFNVSVVLAGEITSVGAVKNEQGMTSIAFQSLNVQPTTFAMDNPASIVLDFPKTSSKLPSKRNYMNNNIVNSVDVITSNGATRAVINLKAPVQYKIRNERDGIFVDLIGVESSLLTQSNQLAQLKVLESAGEQNSKLTSVQQANHPSRSFSFKEKFNKSGAEGGLFSILMPSSGPIIDVKSKDQKIIAVIKDYVVPKNEEKRMDVADYGSPVQYIDIQRNGNNTEITFDMGRSSFSFTNYKNNNRFYIEVSKPQQVDISEITGFGSDKNYTGDTLSLNFQDIEVRAILRIIAEFTDQNIVVSDSVSGNITLLLNNVPWDQALDIILKTKSLAMRKSGSIIYIAPQSELNQSEIEALTDYQKKQNLIPSQTITIQLKYTTASDLAKVIDEARTKNSNRSEYILNDDALMSNKGTIIADDRTNTLVISDIPTKLIRIQELVEQLDSQVRQVMIDSRLVVTADNFSRDMGSEFGFAFNGRGGNTNVGGAGSIAGADTAAGFDKSGQIGTIDLGDRLGVNLPAASAATPSSFGLAILGTDVMVDLELQALQSEGRSEIISSPRVVTQDGYKAIVSSGQEIPYTSVSDSGTDVDFKDAKLSMEVTPRITPNNRVGMDIHITKDSADWSNQVNGEPPLDTNEIDTRVEVDNGETIVLGGIYEQTQSTSTSKVPLLGDIPVLGYLFKSSSKSFNKAELLIFITPRVIDQGLTKSNKFSSLDR